LSVLSARLAGQPTTQGEIDVSDVLTGRALPPGYGSVNPFVAVRGPGGAPGFIRFLEEVFSARETLAAHTLDADELLIHAEVRIGDSTVMLCDAKPHWSFTPALLQVYVRDVGAVLDRAKATGAASSPNLPTSTAGNAWRDSRTPGATCGGCSSTGRRVPPPVKADELPRWRPDPSAPPSYVHQTIDTTLTTLSPP
jgi:PhnB protein